MRESVSGWNKKGLVCEGATAVRVRYAETDAMGWVYYGRYFTYFEIGRTELMRERWRSYADIEKDGYRLPVVSTGCRFLAGAKYDDLLRIVTRVSLASAYRLRFDYRVFCGEKALCEGFTQHCFLGPEEKLAKVPPELATRIRQG